MYRKSCCPALGDSVRINVDVWKYLSEVSLSEVSLSLSEVFFMFGKVWVQGSCPVRQQALFPIMSYLLNNSKIVTPQTNHFRSVGCLACDKQMQDIGTTFAAVQWRRHKLCVDVPAMKITEFANSIDLDEVAHHEPSHLDRHCLPSSLRILNTI